MKFIIIAIISTTIGPAFVVRKSLDTFDHEYMIPFDCFDKESGKILCDIN